MPHDADRPALRLFGTPVLRLDGTALTFSPERRFQLLAVLALADGQWVPRDRLGALLWPEHPAASARSNLRTVVHRARILPGVAALDATEHAVRWVVASDAIAFAEAVRSAEPETLRSLLPGAEQPLLEGLDDGANPAWTDWLQGQRQRLAGLWQSAACAVLDRTEDPAERAALADRMLARDPLDETAMAARLRAAIALGQRAQAQQWYSAFATRLADELGIPPSQRLRDAMAVVIPAVAGTPEPVVAGPDARSGGFVGRRQERAEAQALLARADCRWLTLLGPGGVGKSRLARVVAGLEHQDRAEGSSDFPGGRLWLDLQDLERAPALLPRLGQLIGLQTLDERTAVEQLAAALPSARSLLVLDNAEHLLDGPPEDRLAPLLAALLAARPSLCLLVTSRTRLAGPALGDLAEWLLPVPGLAVPDEESRDLEAATAFDAIRLFEQRARAVDPRFELGAHLDAVIGIAEAVAGMPLALELAASWVRLMPPTAIAAELRRSLDLLQRHPGAAGVPARPDHASMRAVLQRSVDLLSPAERQALAAISVFQDGFNQDSARALGRVAALPVLSALADRSLLSTDHDGRFRLHPLVQALGAELLAAEPALALAVREAHALHFARTMAEIAPLTRGDLRRLVTLVDAEFANVCAAWQAAVERGHARALGEIVRALWVHFEVTGRMQEGIGRLRPALAVLEARAPADEGAAWALVRLRHGLSMLMHRGGHQAEGLAVAEAGFRAGLQGGDLEAHVGCLLNSGSCLMALGRLDEAHARFGQALALAEDHADTHCIAWALGNLAVSHSTLGDADAAIDHGQRALALDRMQGNQYQVAVHLVNLGSSHVIRDDLRAAIETTREAVQHTQAHGIHLFELHARSNLAIFLLNDGRLDEARALTLECLQSARRQGLLVVQTAQLTVLARLEARAGRPEAALRPLAQALALAQGHGLQRELSMVLRAWAMVCDACGRPARAAQALHCAIAMPATPPADATFFRQLLAQLPLDADAQAEAARQVPALDALLDEIRAERLP